jgi:hypothetical protein
MYFKEFPQFLYDFKYGTTTKTSVVTDITRNVRFRKEVLENVTLFDEYDIVDGETPEIVAEKIYGDPEYHWIIMLANQKYDYISDFPLSEQALVKHIANEYNPTLTSTSWSYSGSTVTVTVPLHGLQVSPTTSLTVTGAVASTNAPNGTYNVASVIDANRFTYISSSAPTGTASGTLTINTKNKESYIRHYVNAKGFIVNSNATGAVSVTNDEHERALNESKRRIKVISPQVISTILTQYKELL